MTIEKQDQWRELNDRYTTAAVAWVRALLAERIPPTTRVVTKLRRKRGLLAWLFGETEQTNEGVQTIVTSEQTLSVTDATSNLRRVESEMEGTDTFSQIQQLKQRFDLSPFEVDVLLFCLAFEGSDRLHRQCRGTNRILSPRNRQSLIASAAYFRQARHCRWLFNSSDPVP